MAKNENISRLDMSQIWKMVVQKEHDALRVVHATDVETEISLSHEDGDSIVVKTKSVLIKPETKIDCQHLSKVQAYGDGLLELIADEEVVVTIPVKLGQIVEICAMKLQCDVVLVGQ